MKKITCDYCESTSFHKENNEYICTKCKTRHITCIECNGTGYILLDNGFFKCKICNGVGIIKKDQ